RLRELGAGNVKIVTKDWRRQNLNDPRTVPLITYGICGVNLFEAYDAAYCLTGYYVNAKTLAQVVQDIDATTDQYPVTIRSQGEPRRRVAHLDIPDDRETILPDLAQEALAQKEADVVVQAVGRVRPFTRPREVITFQAGALPGVSYTMEFKS